MEDTTNLFGVPVPSTDKVFIGFVIIHILIALTAVVSGVAAMLLEKGRGKHAHYGRIYFWSIISSFPIIVILSVMRWPHNIHLLSIGVLTLTTTFIGYKSARSQPSNWPRLHTICMGASYILLMTGFYVDNGRNLPVWRLFPQWAFWVIPSIVGVPIIMYVLKRHPLNKREHRRAKSLS